MTIQTTESVADSVAVNPAKVFEYLGLNPNDPKSQAVVAVAQRYDLDPVLKHVIVIPRGGVYITRDGLLHVAHRSGQLDGIVVDQEPRLSEDGKEWVARVSVYRKDMRHPFTFPGRYSVTGGNREYAQEMALKAAEAHALRRAFDVTGLPALDEQREPAQPATGGLGAALSAEQVDPQSSGAEPGTPSQSAEPEAASPAVSGESSALESPLLNTSSRLAKAMYAGINDAGIPKDKAHEFMSEVVGREITSSRELTEDEARLVLDHLPQAAEVVS